jgi:hypothetical protein
MPTGRYPAQQMEKGDRYIFLKEGVHSSADEKCTCPLF